MTNKTPFYILNTVQDSEVIVAILPILNDQLARSDECHHNSGANLHVFHDKTAFEDYAAITPIGVKGFGKALFAVAIGHGTVHLSCKFGGKSSIILLTNILHIPAVRSNLVSGVRLDRAGLTTKLSRGAIILSFKEKPLICGAIKHNMYLLDTEIVRSHSPSNSTNKFNDNIPQIAAINSHDPDFYIA